MANSEWICRTCSAVYDDTAMAIPGIDEGSDTRECYKCGYLKSVKQLEKTQTLRSEAERRLREAMDKLAKVTEQRNSLKQSIADGASNVLAAKDREILSAKREVDSLQIQLNTARGELRATKESETKALNDLGILRQQLAVTQSDLQGIQRKVGSTADLEVSHLKDLRKIANLLSIPSNVAPTVDVISKQIKDVQKDVARMKNFSLVANNAAKGPPIEEGTEVQSIESKPGTEQSSEPDRSPPVEDANFRSPAETILVEQLADTQCQLAEVQQLRELLWALHRVDDSTLTSYLSRRKAAILSDVGLVKQESVDSNGEDLNTALLESHNDQMMWYCSSCGASKPGPNDVEATVYMTTCATCGVPKKHNRESNHG